MWPALTFIVVTVFATTLYYDVAGLWKVVIITLATIPTGWVVHGFLSDYPLGPTDGLYHSVDKSSEAWININTNTDPLWFDINAVMLWLLAIVMLWFCGILLSDSLHILSNRNT